MVLKALLTCLFHWRSLVQFPKQGSPRCDNNSPFLPIWQILYIFCRLKNVESTYLLCKILYHKSLDCNIISCAWAYHLRYGVTLSGYKNVWPLSSLILPAYDISIIAFSYICYTYSYYICMEWSDNVISAIIVIQLCNFIF